MLKEVTPATTGFHQAPKGEVRRELGGGDESFGYDYRSVGEKSIISLCL